MVNVDRFMSDAFSGDGFKHHSFNYNWGSCSSDGNDSYGQGFDGMITWATVSTATLLIDNGSDGISPSGGQL